MKKLIWILFICFTLILVGCGKNNSELESNKIKTPEQIIDLYFTQKSVWEDTETLKTSFGFYNPGFTFFDIDLDGNKELAVQYSGGTMRNCTTKFYKLNGDNVIEVYPTNPELNISIAVANLKKYIDKTGNEFYLNMITYKTDVNVYNTYIDELEILDNTFDLINKFSYIETYHDENNSEINYFIGNTEVTKEEYDKEMNSYLRALEKEEVTFEFINYQDWKNYTDEQKKEALLKAFNA
jgi:hypothetical protein